jgi:hypothetical protein
VKRTNGSTGSPINSAPGEFLPVEFITVGLFHELEYNMKENCASATALRVAMGRAAHQMMDDPKVFYDPLVFRILGVETVSAPQSDPNIWRIGNGIQEKIVAGKTG